MGGQRGRPQGSRKRACRTLFVDYEMPGDSVADLYQKAHLGHPNCRGSRFMAQAVMKRLFDGKVLARGLRIKNVSDGVFQANCSALDSGSCQASPVCWENPQTRECAAYGGGSASAHTVCEGAVCEVGEGALEEEVRVAG